MQCPRVILYMAEVIHAYNSEGRSNVHAYEAYQKLEKQVNFCLLEID